MKPAHILSLAVAFPLFLIASLYVAARNAPIPAVTPPARPPIPKQNGFPLLKQAASEIVRLDDVSNASMEKPRRRVYTLAEKRVLVAANRVAVQKARAALRLPCYDEHPPILLTPFDEDELGKSLRHLAWPMTLAGDVAWEEGRPSEAVDYYLDTVTLGRHLPNRAGLARQRTGLTCEVIGRSHLWRRLKTMHPETAKRCLSRLNELEADRVPLAVSLAEEKYALMTWIKEALEHPERLPPLGDKSDPDEESLNASLTRYGNIVPKKYAADTLVSHMDRLIAQAQKPYSDGNPEIECPRELFTGILAPSFPEKDRCKYTVVQAGDALLRTALAVRIFREDTGKLPAKLGELVTAGILPRVPQDPFAPPGTTLRYLPEATAQPGIYKAVIYSVGPDGVDNRGRGIEVSGPGIQTNRNVSIDSKGDMVAGWYLY